MKGKYAIIDELSDLYPVTLLCELLDVWRSAYYRYLKRKQVDPDGVIKQRIKAIYLQRERTYGYRRIQGELERQYNDTMDGAP
ncbi:IS3 family transposase [Paenibacillus harenae]|uniref:IS3 family transposase n=1 Tax=Paenibacillus harenae TaxID=306543 RepID=UPI002792EB47|nr:hypothetical protein [Paenibacillus harenae]